MSAAAWLVTTSVVVAGWAAIYLLFRAFNHEANAAIGYSRDFGDPLTGGSSSLFGGRPTLFELASFLGPPIAWALAVVGVARLRVRGVRASRRAE